MEIKYSQLADVDKGLMLQHLQDELGILHTDIIERSENADARSVTLKITLQPLEFEGRTHRHVRIQYEIGGKLPGPTREKIQGGEDLLADGKGFVSAEQADLFDK